MIQSNMGSDTERARKFTHKPNLKDNIQSLDMGTVWSDHTSTGEHHEHSTPHIHRRTLWPLAGSGLARLCARRAAGVGVVGGKGCPGWRCGYAGVGGQASCVGRVASRDVLDCVAADICDSWSLGCTKYRLG